MRRILIAGLGNIFHGDDAFGVEVARELAKRPQPAEVSIVDFGIRAYDLAYALTEGYDAVVLVDAVPRGREPGTVCLIEPDLAQLSQSEPNAVDAHSMNPVSVLRMTQSLGGLTSKVFLVGCEPAVLECENGSLGLSTAAQAAVPSAIGMIESLVGDFLSKAQNTKPGLVPA